MNSYKDNVITHNPYMQKPASSNLHNKAMDIHAGSIMIDPIMSVLRFRSY